MAFALVQREDMLATDRQMPRLEAAGQRGDVGPVVPGACLAIFVGVWVCLAVAPRYRADWFLENLPIFVAIPPTLDA